MRTGPQLTFRGAALIDMYGHSGSMITDGANRAPLEGEALCEIKWLQRMTFGAMTALQPHSTVVKQNGSEITLAMSV